MRSLLCVTAFALILVACNEQESTGTTTETAPAPVETPPEKPAVEGAADGIPPDLLREYEGLYKTREHMAVAPVEDTYCQGCYNKITMNDVARLMGAAGVVRCGSCQRILYLPE